jgi:hypothetical protein
VLSPRFLASFWSAGFGAFLQVLAFAFHSLKDCANFTAMPGENNQYSASRQLLLVQYKQQANPVLSIHNYTPPKK